MLSHATCVGLATQKVSTSDIPHSLRAGVQVQSFEVAGR